MVEEHLNSYNSPYKFNAKEYDAETGNYYYGARYYNPKWSIWLSVDPLAEKYPSFSSYAYTLQNPVRYTDPTGMVVEEPPVNGLDWFADDTGEYFWNEEQGKYEHYSPEDGSFQGYYSADEFSEPDLYPGVVIVEHPEMKGGITLGNFIIVGSGSTKSLRDHEYGHYLDFKHHFNFDKVAYLKVIGFPSLWSATKAIVRDDGSHSSSSTERRADILGAKWAKNNH